ncbi:MAG: lysine--tRNA ligase, partial [Oscillospiraceae bacterium]
MSEDARTQDEAQPQLSESEQISIRKDKLQKLKDSGRDPFQITSFEAREHSTEIVENFDSLGL